MYAVNKNDSVYIINEDYFYKTEPYYTIVQNEFQGIRTVPSSGDVLDAYIVPICLEKAKMAGISVCEWVISYSYVTLPAIVYGLNYFSTPSDHFVVNDYPSAKKVIRHVTNFGKYPFCYQKMSSGSEIETYVSIFGKTVNSSPEVASMSEKIYSVFQIPLVTIVLVRDGGGYYLSSLAPVRYSQLTREETELLQSFLETRVNH
ncbi:MAG: hypothetical protein A4E47_00541 [Methanosaeta sp. PtaU1.Bin028]|nr:MAG: hypothetical protein A4E47_00541 [Methanosaeta sp. PtaU1.Bin028]